MLKSYLCILHALAIRIPGEPGGEIPEPPIRIPDEVPGSNPNWMESVPNHVKLSEMLIPGTHDASTYKASGIETAFGQVKTQSWSIATQLNAGIRYIDLRAGSCEGSDTAICMYHGAVYLDLNLNDVISQIHSFIENHPKETLIVRIQKEHDGDGQKISTRQFQDRFNAYIKKSLWYVDERKHGNCGKSLTMGDMRGKIVSFWNNYYGLDYGFGFDECIQSRPGWSFSKATKAVQAFKDIWDKSASKDSDKLYYDIASSAVIDAAGAGLRNLAAYINPKALDYMKEHTSCPTATGFVTMDFPSQDMIDTVISIKCYPPAPKPPTPPPPPPPPPPSQVDMFGWTFYDFEDFVGGDLSNQPATDRNYCQTMCQQVEGCNAYSWSSSQKVCYFKGGIQSSSRREKNKDIYSAILGGRNECVKKGVVYFDNRDFTGGDFKSVGAAGVDECAFVCAFTPGCTAFSFTSKNCYMKKFTVDYPASKPNGNVQSGLLCNKLVTGRDVVRVDNPYAGASGYVSPDFAQSVDSSIARDGSIAGKANVVKNQPTAIWVDTIENLSKIGKHMRNAGRQASASNPVTIQFIVYNLPGRDCHALASNGQIAVGGIDTYKSQYIDRFVDELNRNNNPHVRIVLIIEPDSLPNLATNMDNPRCAAAGPGYKEGVAYALSKLTTIPNVYMYIDVAHGGWLGWEDGQESIVRILQDTFGWARAMNGNLRIQGFATNIANYSPVFSNGVPPAKQKAPMFMAKDKGGNERLTYDYNPAIDENLFLSILAWRFRQAGLPSRFIIDTSRNGVAGIRTRWGSWCNNKGAGIGFRPQANPITNVDAYVWAKPPGESDGASSGNSRVDGFCVAGGPDGFDALYNAPQAGEWFHDQFVELVRNANPPL